MSSNSLIVCNVLCSKLLDWYAPFVSSSVCWGWTRRCVISSLQSGQATIFFSSFSTPNTTLLFLGYQVLTSYNNAMLDGVWDARYLFLVHSILPILLHSSLSQTPWRLKSQGCRPVVAKFLYWRSRSSWQPLTPFGHRQYFLLSSSIVRQLTSKQSLSHLLLFFCFQLYPSSLLFAVFLLHLSSLQ